MLLGTPSELNVFRGPTMKKLCLLVASLFVVLMLSCMPAFADASSNGCEDSKGRASGCSGSDPTAAPEPGSLALLAAGILVVGVGAAIVRRRRLLHN